MEYFKENIVDCFRLVEEKLGRGLCADWSTGDFKILSESIQKDTGTLLSVSTLKRLCGKISYDSKPNSTTLDALAKFIGFDDWRAFVNSRKKRIDPIPKIKPKKRFKYYILPFSLLALVILYLTFLFFPENATEYNADDFTFHGKSVTKGLPNSVVFRFDATAADEKAIIEIQQDWDERKRVLVNREDSVSTSIYYWPGYFRSKLVVDDSIIKERDILIPSLDWLGTIETDSLPIYLDKEDYFTENGLSVKADSLKKYGVDPRSERTVIGLYQIRDFGELYTDDFEVTATLRNDFRSGSSLCQAAQVMIMHEDGPISIVLIDKGCISDVSLYAFGEQIDGKKADLSGFGVDFSNYVQLKCISKYQKMDILVDNKKVFSFEVPENRKKIIGINILFEGAGSVENVTFSNKIGIVYDF